MGNKTNPLQVQQIRAAGTQMPGKRQGKKATKKQSKAHGRVDKLEERLSELEKNIEKAFGELNPVLEEMQKEMRIRALEAHVSLDLIGQNVCSKETMESLMEQRAPQFGLKLEFRKEKVEEGDNIGEDRTEESGEGCSAVPPTEEYKGTEGYSG